MTFLLSNDQDLAARHEFAIGGQLEVIGNRRELIQAVELEASEDIVLVGADMEFEVAAAIAEHFRTGRSSLSVILIRRRVDIQTLNDSLRSGIRDVVSADDATALVDAVKRAKALSSQLRSASGTQTKSQDKGALIVVFSAKGGCGKTTIATNLAIAMGKLGKKTCIIDFDLQFGDVAVALRSPTNKTISDALGMEMSIDRLGVMSLTVPVADNVDALLAPTNPADVELVSGDLAEKILTALQSEYDVVVVDSPPAFTETMIRAFDLADLTLLLTTLDTPAIKNLVLSVKTLDDLGLHNRARMILVNRSDARAGLTIENVEDAVGLPVSGRFASTVDVPASVNQGMVLVDWKPNHKFSKSIRSLAEQICEDLNLVSDKPKRRLFRG